MVVNIRDMLRAHELISAWTYRTIRGRYQQSLLGGLWAILQPAATVAIFSIIFTRFVPVDTGGTPYVLFAYVAMVPWTLFAMSINDMAESLTGNMSLVGKIYFPREILPLAALLARLVDFVIAAAVVVVLMLIYRWPVYLPGVLMIPVILVIELTLALGIGLFGAALNVFYRDVKHIITLGIQIWFYATPIIYPANAVPENLRPYYFLNPMAGVIEAFRSVVIDQALPGSYLTISAGAAVVVLLLGYWLFKRVEFQFADVV